MMERLATRDPHRTQEGPFVTISSMGEVIIVPPGVSGVTSVYWPFSNFFTNLATTRFPTAGSFSR